MSDDTNRTTFVETAVLIFSCVTVLVVGIILAIRLTANHEPPCGRGHVLSVVPARVYLSSSGYNEVIPMTIVCSNGRAYHP